MARLFVAIEIPEEVKAHLIAAIAPLKNQLDLRWSPPRNWHLTLAFLGEANPEEVAGALRNRTSKGVPFDLQLSGWGAFPKSQAARVLWAGVQSSERLESLVREVREASERAAPLMDKKPYTGHITLGRSRSPIVLGPLDLAISASWTVARFALIESKLGANPPYRTIEEYAV